jgi:hypothetical protein
MSIPGDFSYQVGSYKVFVPQFLPDTVVIRPYGEYGMATGGYWTGASFAGGSYGVNTQSYQTDPASSSMSDLVYLVQNDLKQLPTVKRVLIAIYWYTANDSGSGWLYQVGPAIGPEVQSWNWSNAPPIWQVGSWTRSNAYWLKNNHQVWPTPEDTTLIQGIQYLQSQGYEVGLLPINALLTQNYYYQNGGEWEIDRNNKSWASTAQLTFYLNNYTAFIKHYIDLCVANNIRPWLFSIGSGMRDLTAINRTVFPQVIAAFQWLIRYAKQQLSNSLVTYFADLDEYYYPYLIAYYPNNLDPLWTTAELDLVGVNWFAPLALDNSENTTQLVLNTLRGEAYSFYLENFQWRGSPYTDRLIYNTTNNFKTGLAQASINPRINGVKDIEEWLDFNHYYPRIPGRLAGCTPPIAICPGDPKVCTHIIGNALILSDLGTLNPDNGGIALIPDIHSNYVEFDTEAYCYFSAPASIPDNSQLEFEIDFALNALTSSTSQNYRVFNSAFGLNVDVIEGTITLQLPQSNGTTLSVSLFTLWHGAIELVYTPTSVSIKVNWAQDQNVTPASGTTFVMPSVNQTAWMGNPPAPYVQPTGYSTWNGRIYWLKFLLGQGDNLSGGEFYFEDSYNGIRTAWQPNMKNWLTITGYSSIAGSAADPFTRPETIQYNGAANIPTSYEDFQNANAAVFWNNYHLWNIQGPYGSDFAIDEVYQAIALYCATLGLEPAGPQYIAAWFFDTRSPTARLAIMPSLKWQIYNDAYDGEIDCSLNGKAAVRSGGISLQYTPKKTVDEMLGLSIEPGPLPPVRSILVEPGVPLP